MSYPVYCQEVGNAGLDDYTIWRSGPGKAGWEAMELEMQQRNLSLWFPAGRYLGKGFAVQGDGQDTASSALTGDERLYSFGGMCLGTGGFSGNGKNDSFSADLWRLENTTLTGGDLVAEEKEGERASPRVVDVSISISKNPPIPEAGFTITPLAAINGTSSVNGTGNTTSSSALEGMLLLGGYTSQSRFVGLGQLAIYSLENQGWDFVSATVKEGGITPRAGHSAVLDQDAERIILFGGWVGNVTRPASPPMLSLKIGNLEGGWEWETLNTTEEIPGIGPGNMSLWGHAATLLEGNVMLLTSGFEIVDLDEKYQQKVNDKTFLLNLTTNTWISKYKYPMASLSKTAIGEGKRRSHRDIGILAGVFGGILLLVIVLAVLFCYARRQEEYADLPNETVSTGRGDKFHSLDLERGKDIAVDGVQPLNIVRRGVEDNGNQRLLPDHTPGSPELPPRPPAPLRMHRHTHQPSHVDMDFITKLQEEQEQRENMIQHIALDKRRSVRSEMVAWVREWANADAAACAAEVVKRTREDSVSSAKDTTGSVTPTEGKDKHLKPGRPLPAPPVAGPSGGEAANDRCITSSSMYSEGQVSTLTASEIYDTPVEEVPYPVPPMLLSTAQAFGEQSPRHPRVLVGPKGVTTPLPRRMADEFPAPTLIPRDSLVSSAHASTSYNHYSYSSTQPLLQQAQRGSSGDTWRDITPIMTRESSSSNNNGRQSNLYTIPLTTFEETHTVQRGKSLEDRVREEMYNPGPARTEEECRLSSIMDFYAASAPPTPIPEETDQESDYEDDGEETSLVGGVQTSTYSGERAVLGEKAQMVLVTNHTVEEPIIVSPIKTSQRSSVQTRNRSRESVVAPLLSETIATHQQETSGDKDDCKSAAANTKSRIPSLGTSIKRRAAAMAATLSPHSHQSSEKRSNSLGRKSVLHRRPQTSQRSTVSENTPLQPQKAEIVNINDKATDILFSKGLDNNNVHNNDDDMDMDDKVVQFLYTAPKGKLRVVNPSPRRISSGGTGTSEGSLAILQQMHSQRRVSGSGNYGVIKNGEGILRLGSAAARRFGELD
ncbi:hypothetical protein ABW20_dc0103935 [Dactylellina cionopaga]|nr:hypothetical protein ABW20_dc0103935 [Dactylellina cionopaga]